MKLVSVVIPTYGRAEYLIQAVESVLKQTYPNYEIIIVDDNDSESAARKKVKELLQIYLERKNIYYIPLEKNSGGSVARNRGIEFAHGEYVAFLDDDDLFLPEYLMNMVREIEGEGNYDVVYEAQWYVLTNGIGLCSKRHPDKITGNIWLKVLAGEIPISILLLFKKESVVRIGLFDSSLRAYDDFDLWMQWSRSLLFGCVNIPLAVVRREVGRSLTFDVNRMREGLDNIKKKWYQQLNEEERQKLYYFDAQHKLKIQEREIYMMRQKKGIIERVEYYKNIKRYIMDERIGIKRKIFLIVELYAGKEQRRGIHFIKAKFYRHKYYTQIFESTRK